MSSNQIINEILAYMGKFNRPFSAWYFGIASNPSDRLFIDHCVNQTTDSWIHCPAGIDTVARAIEKYFLDKGCSGGGGGGDHTTKSVYAYLITSNTRE